MSLGRKKYRVYFNKSAEAPLIWSIDSGDGTREFKVEQVKLEGLVTARSDMRQRGSTEKPCAWLEIMGTLYLDADDRTATIHDGENE